MTVLTKVVGAIFWLIAESTGWPLRSPYAPKAHVVPGLLSVLVIWDVGDRIRGAFVIIGICVVVANVGAAKIVAPMLRSV